MANRRYFRSSIDELELLFESSKGNRDLLVQLAEELSYRDRPRAKALAKKVADHLTAQAQPKSVENPVPPTQFAPKPNVPASSSRIASTPTSAVSSSKPPNSSRTNPKPTPASPVEQERGGGKPSSFSRAVDFGDTTPQFALEVETKPGPDSVLAAWLTLEVLTPQALPDARELETIGRTLVRLEEYPEPWKEQRYWRHGKERTVHWMVYLGELDLEKATKTMLNKYPEEAVDERADVRGNTTLAVMVVDNQGRPAEGNTFLSGFAWGYGQVRAGRLKGLAAFPEAERAIKMELEKRLVRQDEEGQILPLSYGDIQAAIGWLIKVLNLLDEEVIRPGIAIRVPQWGLYNEPPEPEILNSFFITDLAKTRTAFDCRHVGKALSAYMGV